VSLAVGLAGVHQALDLGRQQVLASAELGIRTPQRANCPNYSAWRDDRERDGVDYRPMPLRKRKERLARLPRPGVT
jgi:hypothetical protein